jgi:hypothetical protein
LRGGPVVPTSSYGTPTPSPSRKLEGA